MRTRASSLSSRNSGVCEKYSSACTPCPLRQRSDWSARTKSNHNSRGLHLSSRIASVIDAAALSLVPSRFSGATTFSLLIDLKLLRDPVHRPSKLFAPSVGGAAQLRSYFRPLHVLCPKSCHFAGFIVHQLKCPIYQISIHRLSGGFHKAGCQFRLNVAETHIAAHIATLTKCVAGAHG